MGPARTILHPGIKTEGAHLSKHTGRHKFWCDIAEDNVPTGQRDEQQDQPAGQGCDDFTMSKDRVWHQTFPTSFYFETPQENMTAIKMSNPKGESGVSVSRFCPNKIAQPRLFKTTEMDSLTGLGAKNLKSGSQESCTSSETGWNPSLPLPGFWWGPAFLRVSWLAFVVQWYFP